MKPSYKLPAGHLDKEAAAAVSNCAIDGCLCTRTWASRYPHGNVLRDFSQPGHPPEGRPLRQSPPALLAMDAEPTAPRDPRHEPTTTPSPQGQALIDEIRRRWLAGEQARDIARDLRLSVRSVRFAAVGSRYASA